MSIPEAQPARPTTDGPRHEDLPTYLTTQELADVVRRPASTVRYWRHTGTGPQGTRVGRSVLYRRSEVLRWLAALEAAEREAAA